MVVTASEVTNGYEQRASGLFVHHGRGDLGSLRVKSPLSPRTGQGLELMYDPTPTTPPTGYIYSYDRDTATWRDLLVSGHNITLSPQQGGAVGLPASAITTAMIADDAVQQRVASYVQQISYALPTSNVWTETPIQVNATFSGAPVRVEFNVLLACPTKGQRIFWGIMLDGAAPLVVLGAMDSPENNYGVMAVGIYYATPTAIPHRFGFGLYGPSGAQIFNLFPSTLYLTEQKR